MKKRIALLCIIAGLIFAACGSRPNDAVLETVTDEEASGTVHGMDAAADTNIIDASLQASAAQEEEMSRYTDAVPVVYMTDEITAESLCSLYQSLGRKVKGSHTAVKVTAGSSAGGSLEPELLRGLVQSVDGTIAVCSTADDGSDTGAQKYGQETEGLGFTDIADVVVLDENGSVAIPVEDGMHLEENYVGAHFPEYDGFLVVSQFQGHAAAGFGGAVKNSSIGISSAEGKCMIYSAGSSRTEPTGAGQEAFLESMAEAAKSVSDALNGNILYINVMNGLIPDGLNENAAVIEDIGMLASADPVALDQACVDLIYMADGNEAFVEQIEAMNAEYVLEYAEEIGLGNSAYTLVVIE